MKWLGDYLEPMLNTPEEEFQPLSADDIKTRARTRLKKTGGDE